MKAPSPATIIQVSELLNEVEGRDMDFSNVDEQAQIRDRNDSKSGLASPNHRASLSGLVFEMEWNGLIDRFGMVDR